MFAPSPCLALDNGRHSNRIDRQSSSLPGRSAFRMQSELLAVNLPANSLQEARSAFEKLSGRAKTMIAGQSGYYVAHCPMLNKDWVQTSTTISNPYGGKDMVSCGEIKK